MLYHYCSNATCFSILSGKNIRMSDISKSNDSEELERFFPCLHRLIIQLYNDNPFPIKCEGLTDSDAIRYLVDFSEDIWRDKFAEGYFSNFVTCFSEKKDCLSQWRGYADNGNGCCIGFSKNAVDSYCRSTNGVLQLKKVKYLTEDEFAEKTISLANSILDELKDLREWIVSEMTKNDADPETDDLMFFNFNGMIEDAFTESLEYKSTDFAEEDEWRIFFADQGYKIPEFVLNKEKKELTGPNLFSDTLNFLNNRIDFRWTENDLIPFVPLKFSDFSECPISEVWIGPKSRVRESDIKLLLRKHEYENIEVKFSGITYR